jgi:hypothetical protein
VAQARAADAAGIDRVGIDLERLGKVERQHGRGTWVSDHVEDDLDRIRDVLRRAQLFARVNPIHDGSRREIDSVLARGVDVVMLPMTTDAEQAQRLVDAVSGRATVVVLVEHADAIGRLPEIVAVDGVDEVHVGLNDLALSLGLANRWLVLAGDLAAEAGIVVRGAGRRFGLGGIGRADDDSLPVPSDLVYAEYARTGATAALISRSFFNRCGDTLARDVGRAREALAAWFARPAGEVAAAHAELARRAAAADCW